MVERILRMKQMVEATGLSPSSIRRRVKAGALARPRDLGGGLRGWRESDVTAFIDGLKPVDENTGSHGNSGEQRRSGSTGTQL